MKIIKTNRQIVISFLLVITTISIGFLLGVFTAPAHEFGHYITCKFFGWNITEVDWYSYVEYSQESIDNASRVEKIIVSISGPIFAPIIPYILILFIKKSAVRDIIALPYLGVGIFSSVGDFKKVIWYLFINVQMPITEWEAFTITNLMVSVLTVVAIMYAIYMLVVKSYRQSVVELTIAIDGLEETKN